METNEILIFQYLDGECTPQQKKQFENLKDNDVEFAELFIELQAVHTAMNNEELMEPSKQFTGRVMEKIFPSGNVNFFGSTFLKVIAGIIVLLVCIYYYQNFTAELSIIPTKYSDYFIPSIILLFMFGIIEFILDYRTKMKY